MVTTLREGKAKLSALVDRAAGGEVVIITVRGRPRAQLCPLPKPAPTGRAPRAAWAAELREVRTRYSVGTHDSSGTIIDDIRGERA